VDLLLLDRADRWHHCHEGNEQTGSHEMSHRDPLQALGGCVRSGYPLGREFPSTNRRPSRLPRYFRLRFLAFPFSTCAERVGSPVVPDLVADSFAAASAASRWRAATTSATTS